MKTTLLALAMTFILTGCAATETKTDVRFVDRPVPIYIVPAPPTIQKPDYETDKLSEDIKRDYKNNTGAIIRAFKITMVQKDQYIATLEEVIEKYRLLSIESKNKLKQLKDVSENAEPQGLFSAPAPSDINAKDINSEFLQDLLLNQNEFLEIEYKYNNRRRPELQDEND